jgi:hypothetical protein
MYTQAKESDPFTTSGLMNLTHFSFSFSRLDRHALDFQLPLSKKVTLHEFKQSFGRLGFLSSPA